MIRQFIGILLLCFLLSLTCFHAQAAEVIHNYDTKIIVKPTGDLHITEIIDVTAEGNQIKRGIYRDLPLNRRTFLGGVIPTKYHIISVKRDGQSEPYHTEKTDNGLRLYIGQSNKYLTRNKRYIYAITYSVENQVFFYNDYDELNWNVIGTNWDFPILNAQAEIILPNDTPILQHHSYTGKALSKDRHTTENAGPGKLTVKATKRLAPHEGMTVALAFPKGYITPAPEMIGMKFFWHQHPGLPAALIWLIALAGYYYYAWTHVGKDPKGRGLTPFYDPPPDISPAMAAHIITMGGSSRATNVTAAIMSLAAKGYVTIEEKKGHKYKVKRTDKKESIDSPISRDEKLIYSDIGYSGMTLKPGSEKLVETAKVHDEVLAEQCNGKYFHLNTWPWAGGIVFLLGALVTIALQPNAPVEALLIGFLFGTVFWGVSLTVAVTSLRGFITAPLRFKAAALLKVIWAAFFSIGGFLGVGLLATSMSWLVIGVILTMGILIGAMYKLMKAPTKEGRKIMDHIAGLRYYMEMVEEKVLQKFDPPQMSRELYEKYLPYAVALGVESKWADKFLLATAGSLTAASAAQASPSWYSGNSYSGGNSFSASSMVSSFTNTVSAAVTSNSSSGGGFSGGGGGGGGGGGW